MHHKQVTAAIITDNGKILITQRAADDKLALKWEFPGGKIEAGETPQECLKREIREELCLDIEVGEHYVTNIFIYETGGIELMAYHANVLGGTVQLRVHHDACWVRAGELSAYDFAPADLPIVERLLDREGGFDTIIESNTKMSKMKES